MKYYPVAEPNISSLEKKYVNDCLNSGWISSRGKYMRGMYGWGGYIEKFEKAYAKFNKTKYAVTTFNGTVSLHLILLALGIKKNDEVIVPNFTYIASANAVLYVGAKPIFVDCDIETYNINVDKIEGKITPKTKAIIIVHLYGNPCEMDKILKIAKKYNLYVIEDAAEAHGATYKNKIVGTFGIANAFSFFGNKTISTGEGGMITTNSRTLYNKINILKNQGQHPKDKRYFHRELGYNYRMTNLQAAIGYAQLKRLNKFVGKKRLINKWYKKYLAPLIEKNIIKFQKETPNTNPSYWMNAITVKNINVNLLYKKLKNCAVQTRPFFVPMNKIPYFKERKKYMNSEYIYKTGIILPSGVNLIEKDIKTISRRILSIIK